MTQRHRSLSARKYVLDANALLAVIEARPGAAEKVRHLLAEALRQGQPLLMSAVNWGEVCYLAWRHHGEIKARQTEERLQRLPIVVMPADRERATSSGALKQKHGLGYADSFAAALAIEQRAWLVTADPEFAKMGKGLAVYPLPRHKK